MTGDSREERDALSRAAFRLGRVAIATALRPAGGAFRKLKSGSAGAAATAKGPIKIWYSNNKEEVAWGKAVVDAWNKDHPNEQVTGEEIPAGKSSEEVIGASITAGNTPCLIFNTAPAAVPQFQKQGGLVALDDFPDAASVHRRSGPAIAPGSTSSPTASSTRCRGRRTR